jgi:hypothetical protein
MADWDKVGVGLPATALVAGLLTGTLLRTSPPPTPPPATVQTQRPAVRPSASRSFLAQLRPVMELLGQSLGIQVDLEGQVAAMNAVLSDADPKALPVDDAEIARLRDSLKASNASCDGSSAADSGASDLIARLVRAGHRSSGAHESAAPKDYASKALLADLEECAGRRALGDLVNAAGNDVNVEFLIATVPDYVDSSSGWHADQVIEAIQSAMTASGFVLDRFKLIDWVRTDKQKPGEVSGGGTRHEKQPGALIFRDTRTRALRVVLLVLETPTGGVHRESLGNAIEFLAAWNARRDQRSDMRIIGPEFSGSIESLALELREVEQKKRDGDERYARFRNLAVVSIATADGNVEVMRRFAPSVHYVTTTRRSSETTDALRAALGRMNPAWADGDHVALLVESNTTFGNGAGERFSRSAGAGASQERSEPANRVWPVEFTYTFPLHIAQLMSDAQPDGSPLVSLLPASAVPLDLRDTTPPADQIPSLRSQLTSPIVENEINGILDNIQHQGVTAVGIVATDERDVLFLARELKRQAPNVQLFFTANNLLYLHSDYLPYVRGALVASTYPLYLPTQTRPQWHQSSRERFHSSPRELFKSMVSQGTFNATEIQLDRPDLTIDYCSPSDPKSATCRPPVWVSVVGDDGFWPITPYDRDPLGGADARPLAEVKRPSEPMGLQLVPLQASTRLLFVLVLLIIAAHVDLVFYAWLKGTDGSSLRRLQRNPLLRVLARPITYRGASFRHAFALSFGFALLAAVAFWWIALLSARGSVLNWFARDVAVACSVLGAIVVMVPAALMLSPAPRSIEESLPARRRDDSNAARGDARDSSAPKATTNPVTWIALGPLMVLFVVAIAAFARFVWSHVLSSHIGDVELAIRLDRFMSNSIVSPGPAILCLAAAIYVSVFAGLRRISLLGAGYTALASESHAFRLLAGAARGTEVNELPLVALLDLPAQNMIWPYSVGTVLLLLTLWWAMPLPSTVDGRGFSIFLTSASALLLGSVFIVLAQALEIWRRLRPGLIALSHSPLQRAFRSVAKVVRWNLSLVSPHLSDLSPVAELADRVGDRRGTWRPLGVPDLWGPCTVSADLQKERECQQFAPLLQSKAWFRLWQMADALVEMLEARRWAPACAPTIPPSVSAPPPSVPSPAVELAERAEVAVAGFAGTPAREVDLWPSLPAQSAPAMAPREPAKAVISPAKAASDSDVDSWFDDCEMLIALQCALVLRDILARVMSCLFTAMACLTLLTAAHLFYLFQGRSAFLTVDLLSVTAASAVSIWLLVSMERDAVLSRLRHKTGGILDINWEFIKRVGIYGILPLLAVLGSLFPEIQQPLFGWLEPLRKLVNF